MILSRLVFLCNVAALLFLSACSSTQKQTASAPAGDSVYPGHYKIGNPYKVDEQWYYPKADPAYVEEGMASWYGPGFHGKRTANGDKYDQKTYTAAHRTLPLPSMVQVTNLANGRSVVAMVNDRGPFSKKRIIDISEKTAIALDMKRQGTARVRVQYLPQQTEEMLAALHLPPLEGKYATAASEYKEPDQKNIGSSPIMGVASANAAEKEPAHSAETAAKHIFIQAGAYGSKDRAEKVAASLSKLGRVGVKPVKVKNGTVYRVRLGPLKDSAYANQVLDQVVDMGNPQAIIVGNSG